MSKKFDSDRMLQFSSSEIKIICDDEVQWTLDGEDGGLCKEVTMKNHQYALPILCDKSVSDQVSHRAAKKAEEVEEK